MLFLFSPCTPVFIVSDSDICWFFGRITLLFWKKKHTTRKIISRLRFGHSRLNSSLFKIAKHESGRCDYCEQQETVQHIIMHCQRFEIEREQLICSLRRESVCFDIINILQKESGNKCYKLLSQYLKQTKFLERI